MNFEDERLRRQQSDDEFLARIRAENLHSTWVTVVGGLAGLTLNVLLALVIMATVMVTPGLVLACSLVGVGFVFLGIGLAHSIDGRRDT